MVKVAKKGLFSRNILPQNCLMAMGTRNQRERQENLWIATSDVVQTPGNAFYDRLNQVLDEHKFDQKVEAVCRKFYKRSLYGRPSMAPGVYFRSMLVGYFEGLDSERGIAWRADSLIPAEISGLRVGRGDAGPFDNLADPPALRS